MILRAHEIVLQFKLLSAACYPTIVNRTHWSVRNNDFHAHKDTAVHNTFVSMRQFFRQWIRKSLPLQSRHYRESRSAYFFMAMILDPKKFNYIKAICTGQVLLITALHLNQFLKKTEQWYLKKEIIKKQLNQHIKNSHRLNNTRSSRGSCNSL